MIAVGLRRATILPYCHRAVAALACALQRNQAGASGPSRRGARPQRGSVPAVARRRGKLGGGQPA